VAARGPGPYGVGKVRGPGPDVHITRNQGSAGDGLQDSMGRSIHRTKQSEDGVSHVVASGGHDLGVRFVKTRCKV